MAQRYFTLSEAHALLPMVKIELKELQKLKTEYYEKYYELKILKSKQPKNEDDIFKVECQLEFLEMEVELHVNNVHSQGIQLKSVDHGLIDFPALHDGEEVLLCWKEGEDRIRFYHNISEGFVGRKPIEPGKFEEA